MFDNYGNIGVMFTIATSVWGLAWWLGGKFDNIRLEIINLGKDLAEKLEYHERHDDTRFSQIHDAVTDLRIKNAANDALQVLRDAQKEKK